MIISHRPQERLMDIGAVETLYGNLVSVLLRNASKAFLEDISVVDFVVGFLLKMSFESSFTISVIDFAK